MTGEWRWRWQVVQFRPDGTLLQTMPHLPAGARICNLAHTRTCTAGHEGHAMPGDDMSSAEHEHEQGLFLMSALAPLCSPGHPTSTPNRTAPIYAHSGEDLVSVIDAGELVSHPCRRPFAREGRNVQG